MRVRLLGAVDVLVDGASRPVPGLRAQALLAALALRPGEIESVDSLVDIVWGERAPSTAAATLQSHASRLRRLLGDRTAILARPPGYVLDLGDDGRFLPTDAAIARWREGSHGRASVVYE